MSDSRSEPVVIVGAGAAGLMAACWAAGGPRPVILLEGSERPGKKILISGGGRCNVLPLHAGPDDFVTDGSLHTLAKILRAWPLDEVRRFFEDALHVQLHVEAETGKLFPAAGGARVVLDSLLTAIDRRGVQVRLNTRVVGLERTEGWRVRIENGETIETGAVVLATGGLSVPATGSDGAGLRIAEALGHSVVPTYPALVPLTSSLPAHRSLAGISLPVILTTPLLGGKRTFVSRGGFLFTHRGYSGPAILNLSHLAVRGAMLGSPPPIWVQWTDLGAVAWDALLRARRGPLLPLLRGPLPERLAAQLLSEAGLSEADGSQLRREDRARLVEFLTHYTLPWAGHEGYRTAEVTGGGIPLNEVDPATLESSHMPGLFFCGEMLDAFGPIGGYNFLWAWMTGRIAGDAVTRR
jgi:predicted Rossmann fold flavoprotein